jgi:integrase
LKGALELDGQRVSGGKVKLPAQKRRPAAWLEPDDLARLAAECKGYESLVWTLGTTGLRIGEACALNVGDVNHKSGRLQVRESKSGEPRSVPVPARVLAMYDLDRAAGEPLFLSVKGFRVNKDNFRNLYFRPALKRAGLAGVWIHGLRHVAASLAIAGGADVKNVQNMLGHKDATMTLNTYAERWDEGLDDVAKRMDQMFGGDDE